MDLVDELRALRIGRGWSQLRLALAAGAELASVAELERTGDGTATLFARCVNALGARLVVALPDGQQISLPQTAATPAVRPGAPSGEAGGAVQLARAFERLGAVSSRAPRYLSVPGPYWRQVADEVWGKVPGLHDTWDALPTWRGLPVSVAPHVAGVVRLRRLRQIGGARAGRWPDVLATAPLVPSDLSPAQADIYETLISGGAPGDLAYDAALANG